LAVKPGWICDSTLANRLPPSDASLGKVPALIHPRAGTDTRAERGKPRVVNVIGPT
jgi:hypothetical protein